MLKVPIPSPQQLGLHIDSWRDGQRALFEQVKRSVRRVKVACAPTGFGKSDANVGIAIDSGHPTAIVTQTKTLQDQYMDQFKHLGMVDLRGRANYQCAVRPKDPFYTCEDGYAAQCPHRGSVQCPSSASEMAASTSRLVVTNYPKWIASKRYGTGLSHITQVIFDEAHNMYDALASAMQIKLQHKEIEEKLKLDFPMHPEADDMVEWKRWSIDAKTIAEDELSQAQARITGVSDPRPSHVRHFNHMRNLVRKLCVLNTCRAADWIVQEIEGGYVFDPIRPARYSESMLLLKVPSIICASATVHPKTMFMCGIGRDQFDFTEFDSEFDPDRSPFYYLPVARVDDRNKDELYKIWLALDRFAYPRRDRNGAVQTVSYDRSVLVRQQSNLSPNMIWNDKEVSLAVALERFRNTYPGAILVSPSIEEGLDFKGRQCEWQFLTKIPFDPPSKILKAREEDDPEYRSYNAIQRIEQMAGRGMRYVQDQCENLLCDSHMDWWWGKTRHLSSHSFRKRIRPITRLPEPPPRLVP